MQDFARQAATALVVYLERGRKALECLNAGRTEEATGILAKRNAAFHNFRARDALALAEGQDLNLSPEVQGVWQEIKALDLELKSAVQQAHAETGRLYQRVREARQKIGRYRSGSADQPSFEKTA